ncbi:MAG: c-type cytochrome [Bacteroidota bacterium]
MKKLIISTLSLSIILSILACSSGNEQNNTETTTEQTSTAPSSEAVVVPDDINDLLSKNTCLSCHDANDRIVGPAYKEIAQRNYTDEQIVELIYKPNPSNWPDYPTPMIGLPNVPKEEALKIAAWINSLKK